MNLSRANKPVEARLEVQYSSGDDNDDHRVVGTLLRVRPDTSCKKFEDGKEASHLIMRNEDIIAGFGVPLSNNVKVCDLYQCVHHSHDGNQHRMGYDGYCDDKPAICARRFSETALTRLGEEDTLDEGRIRPARRAASWSLPGTERVHALDGSTRAHEVGSEHPFRHDYSMMREDTHLRRMNNSRSSMESIEELISSAEEMDNVSEGSIINKGHAESLHACQLEYPEVTNGSNNEERKSSTPCSLDLSSPCSRHHHRRNSMAVKFEKPFYKAI